MSELANEVKIQILQRQLSDWVAAEYDLTVQVKVQKRIGGEPQAIEQITKRIEQCVKAQDAIREEVAALS